MTFSDEVLMAYADGELDATTRAQVQQAIGADPELARRVAAHAKLRSALRSSFDPVLDERIPGHLLAAARSKPREAARRGNVPLPRGAARPWLQWGSLAASFVLGALAWQLGMRTMQSGPIMERGGKLLASGELARALSVQLAHEQSTAAAVQIGVSFRSRTAQYCRTFLLRDREQLAGLACREGEQWQLEMLARNGAPVAGPNAYRQAASALPPALVQAVSDMISGEPLDAQAEATARARQWRAPPSITSP